jgi:hypothetical protein
MSRNSFRRLPESIILSAVLSSGFVTLAAARDLNVSATAPLEPVKLYYLDKANGIGPRFRFVSAPPELSLRCAVSIRVNVNDANYVAYTGARTVEEFRSEAAAYPPLTPSEAEKSPQHATYALKGEGAISNAMCTNLFAGVNGRGFCSGTVSGRGYTIVYNFDPVACHYDNVAPAASLQARLSVDSRDDQKGQPECAAKTEQFVADIDGVLAGRPNDILVVFDVLDRHFPLHGCTLDAVSNIVKTSRYFRSISPNGPKMYVFVLNSGEVTVTFGLTDSGDSDLPSAMWSHPSP